MCDFMLSMHSLLFSRVKHPPTRVRGTLTCRTVPNDCHNVDQMSFEETESASNARRVASPSDSSVPSDSFHDSLVA